MQIPFISLKRQYDSIRQEIDQAIEQTFIHAQFIGGPVVKNFESEFSLRLGMQHCISTGNGTDSLFIILKALNLKPGDEVITPAFSCFPSAEIISLTGATPVFCDVERQYYTLDPEELKRKITPATKAVIAVHLYGQSADINALKKICDENNLLLIEDCAQAHLTRAGSKPVGTFGIASAFSFYPTKNLGAFGDAGCILTNDEELAEKMRRLANHGALHKDDHMLEGTNSRMDTLQAALLSVKLKHLNRWNARRREIAGLYKSQLRDIDNLILPAERENTFHTFHIFCICTPFRDSLKEFLSKKGIDTQIHYPKGIPFTQAYRHNSFKQEEFPVTSTLQNQVLSLPVFPELIDEEVTYISQTIRQYFGM